MGDGCARHKRHPASGRLGRVLQQLSPLATILHTMITIEFLTLPDELIQLVVYHLSGCTVKLGCNTDGCDTPAHVFQLNHRLYPQHCIYTGLLALSSTCSRLRVLLAPHLFHHLSLVRENELDSILCMPRHTWLFSDALKYLRQLVREILQRGFRECSQAQLACQSFRSNINEDPRFVSRYEREIGLHNFVQLLECGNQLVATDVGKVFGLVRVLKILDVAALAPPPTILTPLKLTLSNLSINIVTFVNYAAVLPVSQLRRIDLFIDICDLSQSTFSSASKLLSQSGNLAAINLFVSQTQFIKYAQFLEFFSTIVKLSEYSIAELAIRKCRRNGDSNSGQFTGTLFDGDNGTEILKILLRAKALNNFSIDLAFYKALNFDRQEILATDTSCEPSRTQVTLLLVESVLSVPMFFREDMEKIVLTLASLQANRIRLYYGDALKASNMFAINALAHLASFLGYKGYRLSRASVEMCWSVIDDEIQRSYYKVHQLTHGGTSINGSIWSRLPTNSPRYRVCEPFTISYRTAEGYSDVALISGTKTTKDDIVASRSFWSVETAMCDLEEYSPSRMKSIFA